MHHGCVRCFIDSVTKRVPQQPLAQHLECMTRFRKEKCQTDHLLLFWRNRCVSCSSLVEHSFSPARRRTECDECDWDGRAALTLAAQREEQSRPTYGIQIL